MRNCRLAAWCVLTVLPVAAQGPSNVTELEAFVDGFMASALEAHDTAGATVSVVKDGEIFLAKGYGDADVENDKKVAADHTLFRIGSVSKLFVWTAVMQQVEEGRIDLDADVNDYLSSFQLPETYAEPVTMKSLMAHAPGFEDLVVGIFAKSPDRIGPLGDLLAQEIPKRVRPPMVASSYSNHGTALAAHILENVSGMEFNEYIESHIFQPLGMKNTTFRQPVPAPMLANVSHGYRKNGGKFVEEDFEYIPLAPAGAASATATDMAIFMIAHLQDGRYGDGQILAPQTARLMHSELFRHADGVNAMAHGFYEMSRNGERIIGHGGDTLAFHTELALFPDKGLGFFVSFNSVDGAAARSNFSDAFVDHYFPVQESESIPVQKELLNDLGRFAGYYRVNRYSHSSLAKIAGILQTTRIVADDDALIFGEGPVKRWVPIGPLLFRGEGEHRTLAFREDASGNITHAFLGDTPVIALDRLDAWYESPVVHAVTALSVAAILLLAVIHWPVSMVLRWRYDADRRPSDMLPVQARASAWTGALAYVSFLAGFLMLFTSGADEIVFGVTSTVWVLFTIPVVACAFALMAVVFSLRAWFRGQGSLGARIRYSIVTVALVVGLVHLAWWNLLGYRF